MLNQLTHFVVVRSLHLAHTPRTHPEGLGGCQLASNQQTPPQDIVQDLAEVTGPLSAHFSLQFCGYIIINCHGSSHMMMLCVGIMMSRVVHIDAIPKRELPLNEECHLAVRLQDFKAKIDGSNPYGLHDMTNVEGL